MSSIDHTKIFSLSSTAHLDSLYDSGIRDFIIQLNNVARIGLLNNQDLEMVFNQKTDINLFLQADLIIPERDLDSYVHTLQNLLQYDFTGIRVQDLGVLSLLHEQTDKDIHYIAETGFRNIESLKCVKESFPKIRRFVLNSSLGGDRIKGWLEEFTDLDFELFYFGDLPVFYSHRHLLDSFSKGIISTEIKTGNINDKGEFKVLQTNSGTLIFFGEQYYGSNLYSALKAYENFSWRISGLYGIEESYLSLINEENFKNKSFYTPRYLYGQIESGRFHNKNLAKTGRNIVGEILETRKREYMVVELKSSMQINDSLIMITPDGYEDVFKVGKIMLFKGEKVTKAQKGDIVVMPFRRKSSSRSLLYREE